MSALEEAIVELAPNDQWEMKGRDLSGLTWFGPGPRPTNAAINAKVADIVANPRPSPRKAPPIPSGVSIPALRAEVAALRQVLIDAGILDE